jgi:hypothetical protein
MPMKQQNMHASYATTFQNEFVNVFSTANVAMIRAKDGAAVAQQPA